VTFAGAQAGDLAVVIIDNSSTAFGPQPAGWSAPANLTWATFGYQTYMTFKALSAGEVAAGVTFNTLGATDTLIGALVYRGPTSAAVVGQDDQVATVNIPGFVKAAPSKAIITHACSRGAASVFGPPAGVTNRVPLLRSFAGAGNFCFRVDDILPASAYVNGTILTYTGGSVETIGQAIELT
jgi:hypothetical protein